MHTATAQHTLAQSDDKAALHGEVSPALTSRYPLPLLRITSYAVLQENDNIGGAYTVSIRCRVVSFLLAAMQIEDSTASDRPLEHASISSNARA